MKEVNVDEYYCAFTTFPFLLLHFFSFLISPLASSIYCTSLYFSHYFLYKISPVLHIQRGKSDILGIIFYTTPLKCTVDSRYLELEGAL